MLRDITLGQYYPADSILHRLDPRVKFVSTLVYIISLFVFSSWVGYGVAALFLVAFPSFCSTIGAICLEPYSLR